MADRNQEHVWLMSDIVLTTINAKWIHPSLALRLLKANLEELEDRCTILEFALRQPLEEKVNTILAARPRILGLSVSVWNHLATIELLKALDGRWDQKPFIVLGGPEVSWLPKEAEILRLADHVIRGEGEDFFRSLCHSIILGSVQECVSGSIPEENNCITYTDLSRINSAYHLYTDEDLQKKHVYVEASRGCPYGCEFCQGPAGSLREFPLKPFLTDMGTLIERGARTFKFLDRSFNINIDRSVVIMEFFLEKIKSRKSRSKDERTERPLCVHFEMVPFRFPPELREVLSRFPPGTLRLELGVQTLNPAVRELIMQRSVSPDGMADNELDNIKFLRQKTNAILHVDLIAGLPGEEFASFGRGFDLVYQALSVSSSRENPCQSCDIPFEIQMGILKCLPGTPIVRHNKAYSMQYSTVPPYEVMETGVLPMPELDRLKNFARFWELIVNRNHFPDLLPRIFLPGKQVFKTFMDLSDRLLRHFGKNWGLDRNDLRLFLDNYSINCL